MTSDSNNVGDRDSNGSDSADGDETGIRSQSDPTPTPAEVAERAAQISEDETAREQERRLMEKIGVEIDEPDVHAAIDELAAGADDDLPFGRPGQPLSERSALRIGFVGALGVGGAILIGRLLITAAPILLLIGIAMFLAVGLDPAVTWLQNRGMRRGLAVFVTVAVVVLFAAGFLAAAVPPLVEQGTELVDELPSYLDEVDRTSPFLRELNDRLRVTERIQGLTSSQGDVAAPDADQVVGVAKVVFGGIASTITVLVLSLYFLASLPKLKRTAYRLVPRSRRGRFALLSDEILARIGSYLLGNLATSFVAGLIAYIFFKLLGVPYPLPLAMFVALTDMLPLVGATIGAAASILVAFSVSVPVGLIAGAYFVIYQQFENFILIPRVMKRAVDVSPIATIVGVLIGASLLGIFGAILAVPIAASIQIIGREIVLPRQEAA